jgi:hypothetical protein
MGFAKAFGGAVGVVLGLAAGFVILCLGCGGCVMFLSSAGDAARQAARDSQAKQEARERVAAEVRAQSVKPSSPEAKAPTPAADASPAVTADRQEASKSGPQLTPTPMADSSASEKPPEVAAKQSPDDEPEEKRRTWTDSTGKHTIEAEFKGLAAGQVKLVKADGSSIAIALDKLSEEDQAWIRKRPRIEETRRTAAAIERKRAADEQQREARRQAAAEERRREAASKNLGITMAAYNQIKTGMTYNQVVEIIGKGGKELSRNNLAGVETVMVEWTDGLLGPNMNMIFQGGRLVQKAQFGLK